MHYLVYQTTNLINGKRYIGVHRTPDIEDGYMGSGTRLKHSIKKYGLENFTREILEICLSSDEMFAVEIRLIAEMKPEYNIACGGEGGFGQRRHSQESKKKISDAARCRKPIGEETRKKMREAGLGRIPSEAARKKMSNSRIGKPHSETTRKKMSASHIGKTLSEETRNKLMGRTFSEETRKKLSAIAMKRTYTEETRKKMRDAWARRRQASE